MWGEIMALMLSDTDLTRVYKFPDEVEWEYYEHFQDEPRKIYDFVLIDRDLYDDEFELVIKFAKAYTVFLTDNVTMTDETKILCKRLQARIIKKDELGEFFENDLKFFYSESYGDKLKLENLAIAQGFRGDVIWNGNCSVTLNSNYGDEYKQVTYWRDNIPIYSEQFLDYWLEFKKDSSVEIALEIVMMISGSISKVVRKYLFEGEDLEKIITIQNDTNENCLLFISVLAKGKGKLDIISLHNRFSRGKYGQFIPGGCRHQISNREEFFSYFDPGDLKPPLCIYFSGYKTKEGFEGYYMMRKMGCPFLLISDSRLEGGAFYKGNLEFEKKIVDVIRSYMKELGFDSSQVIMSGLSMGTFGALYYGADIRPYALLLGKPLASIGDVAANETRNRPGGFPTSLDVVKHICGGTSNNEIEKMNSKFWDKFDKAEWNNTRFVISYMIEDDYDSKAYNMIISNLLSGGVTVYGKGIHGRHNDDTLGILRWFTTQYNQILHNDFNREK